MEYNYPMLNQLMKTTNLGLYQKIMNMKSSSQMPTDRANFIYATKDQLEYYIRVKKKELVLYTEMITNVKCKLDAIKHECDMSKTERDTLQRKLDSVYNKTLEQKTAADEKIADLEQTISDLQLKSANLEQQTERLKEQLKVTVAQNQVIYKKYLESEKQRVDAEENLTTLKRKYDALEESHNKTEREFKRQKVKIMYEAQFNDALESLGHRFDKIKQKLRTKYDEQIQRESQPAVPPSSESITTTSNVTEPATTTETSTPTRVTHGEDDGARDHPRSNDMEQIVVERANEESVATFPMEEIERSTEGSVDGSAERSAEESVEHSVDDSSESVERSADAFRRATVEARAFERKDKKNPNRNTKYSWIQKLVHILVPGDQARQEALYAILIELPRCNQKKRFATSDFASLRYPRQWSCQLADFIFGPEKATELDYIRFVEAWVSLLAKKPHIKALVGATLIATIYNKDTKDVVRKIKAGHSTMDVCMQETLRKLL